MVRTWLKYLMLVFFVGFVLWGVYAIAYPKNQVLPGIVPLIVGCGGLFDMWWKERKGHVIRYPIDRRKEKKEGV